MLLYKNGELIEGVITVPDGGFTNLGYDPDDIHPVLRGDFDGNGIEEEIFLADKGLPSSHSMVFLKYEGEKYVEMSKYKIIPQWTVKNFKITQKNTGEAVMSFEHNRVPYEFVIEIKDGKVLLYYDGKELGEKITISSRQEVQ